MVREREKSLSGQWFRTEAKLAGSSGYRFPWTAAGDESLTLVLRLSLTFPNLFQYNNIWTSQYRNMMVYRSGFARVTCEEAHHSLPFGRREIWKKILFILSWIVGLHILYCPITKELAANGVWVSPLCVLFFPHAKWEWQLQHPFPESGGRAYFLMQYNALRYREHSESK